ncbi:MAG TPA: hypothetical protein VII78_03455 [Myxococcota bacterium]
MPPPEPSRDLALALCRIFLGWKLREDYAALIALGEGALRIDLLTAEAWCDGEPLPPLFIAGELARELAKEGVSVALAQLDAVFAPPAASALGVRRPPLDLTCRVTLRAQKGALFAAEANNGESAPGTFRN